MIAITYKALYRVYRPQSFGDLVGQEAVTRTLRNAIKEKRISHAYLFNGPRGTGKTTAAKIFAKAVNCLNPQDGDPCNECRACISVQQEETMDIIEIDAASNRGIDEIRDLRDKVNLGTSSLTYKVYIIDEVHMLTQEAFNALLKTLEEPPSHVIFIFATTEPHKLPLTIISRCQRFDFHHISLQGLMHLLRSVSDRQGIQVADDTLMHIARFSEGGGRDALSVLDQAYSFAGDAVTMDDIHLITGTLSNDMLQSLIRLLQARDRAKVIALIDETLSSGKDPEQVVRGMIQYARDLLVYQNAPLLEEMQARIALEPEFQQLSEEVEADALFATMEHLSKVQNDMKYSPHPRILLEVVLIQLMENVFDRTAQPPSLRTSSPGVPPDVQDVIAKLEERIAALENSIKRGIAAPSEPASKAPEEERKRTSSANDLPLAKLKAIYEQGNDKYLQRISEIWASVLEGVRIADVRASAWLKQGKPVVATEHVILLAFNSLIHRENTEQPDNKKIIEDTLYDRTNIRFEIVTMMHDQWTDFIKRQGARKKDDGNETSLEPLVAEALQLVGEELVEIKK